MYFSVVNEIENYLETLIVVLGKFNQICNESKNDILVFLAVLIAIRFLTPPQSCRCETSLTREFQGFAMNWLYLV